MTGLLTLETEETITVNEVPRAHMPVAQRSSKWDRLYQDILLRLEVLNHRQALLYTFSTKTAAHNAKTAIMRRLSSEFSPNFIAFAATTEGEKSYLYVARGSQYS